MLTSVWLADATDEDNVEHPQQQQQHEVEAVLDDPMVPEQFLEVDMNNFYLPTPPESSELWQENFLAASGSSLQTFSSVSGAAAGSGGGAKIGKPVRGNAERRFYCPRCAKAFSRTDSLRRHEKLYCRSNRESEQPAKREVVKKDGVKKEALKKEPKQRLATAPS
ncbi:uncharacterized protein LOC106638496 [Copidosoma floridanum]|uniref:uncharacterized protein LOC106638496 n=1 Tax=Copidosoma floridanum TaxID=29053 RepID=UPI0006C96CCD|nr:uncharacterized protein LOC106638496 [Copidosoma floridanum]